MTYYSKYERPQVVYYEESNRPQYYDPAFKEKIFRDIVYQALGCYWRKFTGTVKTIVWTAVLYTLMLVLIYILGS